VADTYAPSKEGHDELALHFFEGHIGGYASRRTYLPGEEATMWIATEGAYTTDCYIKRSYGGDDEIVASFEDVEIQDWKIDSCFRAEEADTAYGCNWNITLTFIVGDWDSTMYSFMCEDSEGSVDFVVGVDVSTGDFKNKALFITQSYTTMAYNPWGGRSRYGFINTTKFATWLLGVKLPWARPSFSTKIFQQTTDIDTLKSDSLFYQGSQFFHREIMHANVYDHPTVEKWATISEDRIAELGLDYLSKFGLVIFLDKYEYTTASMWEVVINYVKNGGNLFIKNYEHLLSIIEDEGDGLDFSILRCFFWAPGCYGPQYMRRKIPEYENFDLDVFGINLRYMTATEGEQLYVVDENNWLAQSLGLSIGDYFPNLAGNNMWYLHAKLVLSGNKWCFAEGTIPCSNITIVAKTDEIIAYDTYARLTYVHGVVVLIRHGNGEMVVVSPDFRDGDYKGIALVEKAMEHYIPNGATVVGRGGG